MICLQLTSSKLEMGPRGINLYTGGKRCKVVFIMFLFIDLWAFLSSQDPREQPAVPAQAATDPHAAAVGPLHWSQHHLDGVSQ